MATAYIAEIDTNDGTRYLSTKSKLSQVPFFFRSVSHLRRSLSGRQYRIGPEYYVPSRDEMKTAIVKVENLERGLRSSSGVRMSVHSFKQLPTAQRHVKMPANAVFKIQLNSAGTGFGPKKKKFAGDGKFGKTWNRQGDARNHISSNIHWLKTVYKDAVVATVTMNPDGITVSQVSYTPIVEWYRRSQFGNRTYLRFFQETMSDGVISPRSDYS